MATIHTIREDFDAWVCRQCINDNYDVDLMPGDCRYEGPYLRRCRNCGEMHHIVVGLKMSGKIKLMGKSANWKRIPKAI